MAKTKCDLLGVPYSELEKAYLDVRAELLAPQKPETKQHLAFSTGRSGPRIFARLV